MIVTVNIGGDSKAGQATVTGTGLSGLIVTGTVQEGSGSRCGAPPGVTFQYIGLVPARYGTITKAVINFTVPQSWLDEHRIDPGNIVLYRQTSNCWEALPTTMLSTKDGTVYFSAESTGFSLFAIAGIPDPTAPATVATSGSTVEEQVTTRAIAVKAPVTMKTTAPPAAPEATAGPSAFPVLPALIGIGCIGLAGSGWYIRRWWIRRQNPALFMEYD
jgi:PGF-pre-PGF domain-containing protein